MHIIGLKEDVKVNENGEALVPCYYCKHEIEMHFTTAEFNLTEGIVYKCDFCVESN